MDETSFDWIAFSEGLKAFITLWQVPFKVLLVIVIAVALNWILRLIIRRVVDRVVNGVKRKQNVEDTAALFISPLATVRVVQRPRALGTVLNSAVAAVVVIIAALLLVAILFPNATGA